MESYNLEGPYFRVVLGFIGITDITIVHAGGTNKVAQGVGDSACLRCEGYSRG